MVKKKLGAPKKPAAITKVARIELRMIDTEKQAFSEAASMSGLSLSAWIRVRLRAAAKAELESEKRPVPFL